MNGASLLLFFVSLKIPYIVNLTNAIGGGIAGLAWHFTANRFFR